MEHITATVTYLFNHSYAEVAPWDGGDGPGETRAVAEVRERVKRDDVVELRPASPRQDPWAGIIYALPVVSCILGYLMGAAAKLDLMNRLAAGAILGVMALALSWIANRRTRLRRALRWEIVRVVRQGRGDGI